MHVFSLPGVTLGIGRRGIEMCDETEDLVHKVLDAGASGGNRIRKVGSGHRMRDVSVDHTPHVRRILRMHDEFAPGKAAGKETPRGSGQGYASRVR